MLKTNLKIKLIISYVFLSMFLVFSLLIISNYMFEKHFQEYVLKKQEDKNMEIVLSVLKEFEKNGKPKFDFLHLLGQRALNDGVILMVSDKFGNKLFCMTEKQLSDSEDMLKSMKEKMIKHYPNWQGEYKQVVYGLTKDNINYGKVTLGYYGPFYYTNADMIFIDMLNQIFFKVSIVFFIIAIAIGYYMAIKISKPIRQVIEKTKKIEQGDYSDRIDIIIGTNEIDQLITSVNNLANTLEKEQKIKKRMSEDYAHEFRTPLATLQSNFEGMIDGIFEPTPERLESCIAEILRLSRMISDIDKITNINNINTKNIMLDKKIVELDKLLEQLVLNFENDLIAKNILLKLDTDSCNIYLDKDKISQVIVNLISNAIKYTNDDGFIEVKLKSNIDFVTLSVKDNGIGIHEDDLPYIFEHLYRTDKSRTRITGGSGIGLSIVKAIVNAHDGFIEVKSEISVGSEFIVMLKNFSIQSTHNKIIIK